MGNRSIWFGAIFPDMVMGEMRPYCLVPQQSPVDVASLLEHVLYCSSIYFNPVAFFIRKTFMHMKQHTYPNYAPH